MIILIRKERILFCVKLNYLSNVSITDITDIIIFVLFKYNPACYNRRIFIESLLRTVLSILSNVMCTKITGLKQCTLLEKVLIVAEESTIEQRKIHKEAMACQDKLLDI